jgi:hypothetical protein
LPDSDDDVSIKSVPYLDKDEALKNGATQELPTDRMHEKTFKSHDYPLVEKQPIKSRVELSVVELFA